MFSQIKFKRFSALVSTLLLGLFTLAQASFAQAEYQPHKNAPVWVGSWAAALKVMAPGFDADLPALNDRTLRQIVHISVGGKAMRIRFSNTFGNAPLTIGAATVAVIESGATINSKTLRTLKFGGQESIKIAPGAQVFSDPVRLHTQDFADIAISLYLPDGATPVTSPVSYHVRALQTSYITDGDATHETDPNFTATTAANFYISGLDVKVASPIPVVVMLGDSITDGDQSTPNMNQRLPNLLAQRLNRGHRRAAVLNLGISGNQLVNPLLGESGQARFDRDVLGQTGVTHVIVLEGINDIGLPALIGLPLTDTADIISGHQQIIARGKAQSLKMIGGTLTPSGGFALPRYNTPEAEADRQIVNQWIRYRSAYDAVVDFDALLKDPASPNLMQAELTADGLHPNDDGYLVMAKGIKRRLIFGGRGSK